AWNELKTDINEPLQIDSSLTDLLLVDASKSYLKTLENHEYTAEVRIEGDQITAEAEFKKSLPFVFTLDSFDDELVFNSESVKAFGVVGYKKDAYKAIRILYYRDDKNFTIKLIPQDSEHEIILHMTQSPFVTMADLVAEIDRRVDIGKTESLKSGLEWKYYLDEEDEVVVPKINFNIEKNYAVLEGNSFAASDRNYKIEEAFQRTAFILNEKGAEVETEARVVALADSVAGVIELPKPKKMRFDKPFYLMLRRSDSSNPYFAMWLANTELMVKNENSRE
ncbi:MAG: hypothetical protein HOP30_04985, partial [Cyclobacteriaceae bacterium]|nr:hypothetical protein [Cyclobacteriaceae bacterium]